MLKEKTAVFRKTLFVIDILLVVLSYFVALYIRINWRIFRNLEVFPGNPFSPDTAAVVSGEYLMVLALAVPLWCLVLYTNGIYRPSRTDSIFEELWALLKSFASVLIGFGAFVFLLRLQYISRSFILIFFALSLFFLVLEKTVIFYGFRYIQRRGHNIMRLLIVGTGRRAAEVIRKIKSHPEWGLNIRGAIDDEPERGIQKVEDVAVIGPLGDIGKIIKDQAIDEVIFVVPRSRLNHIENAIYECEVIGVKATLAMDLYNHKIAKYRNTELDGIPFISFETTVANETQLFIKRLTDVLLAGAGLVITLPFLILIGVLIKATSRGPVIFVQMRAGRNGRKFRLYKFRTMFEGADKERDRMEAFNDLRGPVFKIKNDPRVTPVGRFLRKYSLDELPQLVNILAGHMSIVGPRALALYEVKKFELWQMRRLSMRPGLTCLWQIAGRNTVNFEKWMELDLYYLDNWSFWLDLKIILKTIPVVLSGKGAY